MHEELEYVNSEVWTGVPASEALRDPSAKITGSRWVLCSRNDVHDPDVRARLVAHEANTRSDTSFFAATPPLESKRMMLSQYATERTRKQLQAPEAQLH